MFENLLESSAQGHFGVWGLFLVLVACGLGVPLPEDIVLFASGLLARRNNLSLIFVVSLMYVGILIGDSIIYALGRYLGRPFLASRFGRWVLPDARMAKARGLLGQYGNWIVAAARFMPGLRAPIFFTTGLLRFSYGRFALADGVAALLSAPLFVLLGHWAWGVYADNIGQLEHVAGRGQKIFFAVVGLTVLVGGIWLWRKTRRQVRLRSSSGGSSG